MRNRAEVNPHEAAEPPDDYDDLVGQDAFEDILNADKVERGLCLSGRGYRAMVFHAGALKRLNELGLLVRMNLISSVSGGSILNGILATHWQELQLDATGHVFVNFDDVIIRRVRQAASTLLDVPAVLLGFGALIPWLALSAHRISDFHTFGGFWGWLGHRVFGMKPRGWITHCKLNALDTTANRPQFTFNATSTQTGKRWYFHENEMGDYLIGKILFKKANSNIVPTVAQAVAASGAFPVALAPFPIIIDKQYWQNSNITAEAIDLQQIRSHVDLMDGGVYDNLGLQEMFRPGWKVLKFILSSNGGGADTPKQGANWLGHDQWALMQLQRLTGALSSQVAALRRKDLIERFLAGRSTLAPQLAFARKGTAWNMGALTEAPPGKQLGAWPGKYPQYATDLLVISPTAAEALAATPTRLAPMSNTLVNQLLNLGYAHCDQRVRRFCTDELETVWKHNSAPAPKRSTKKS